MREVKEAIAALNKAADAVEAFKRAWDQACERNEKINSVIRELCEYRNELFKQKR